MNFELAWPSFNSENIKISLNNLSSSLVEKLNRYLDTFLPFIFFCTGLNFSCFSVTGSVTSSVVWLSLWRFATDGLIVGNMDGLSLWIRSSDCEDASIVSFADLNDIVLTDGVAGGGKGSYNWGWGCAKVCCWYNGGNNKLIIILRWLISFSSWFSKFRNARLRWSRFDNVWLSTLKVHKVLFEYNWKLLTHWSFSGQSQPGVKYWMFELASLCYFHIQYFEIP